MSRRDRDVADEEGSFIELEVDGIRMWRIEVNTLPLPDCLTEAETEVVRLVLDGKSNREIAALRATSERTTANQLASIYKKVGVNSRTELVGVLARSSREGP